MRRFIDIVSLSESATIFNIAADRDDWLASFAHTANTATIASVLEDQDSSEEELIEMWFDYRLMLFKRLAAMGDIPVYRHMKVGEFDEFVEQIDQRGCGEHWSINHSIETPNWTHDGDTQVLLQGTIKPEQIDWEQTLRQQFEWPEEGEMIFSGGVFVKSIENMDEDETVQIGRMIKR